MFKLTIKNRLIIAFLAILLVPCSAIGYFSYQSASSEVTTQMMNNANNGIDSSNDQITELITQGLADMDYLAKAVNGKQDVSKTKEILDGYKAVNYEYDNAYYGNTKKDFIASPDLKMDAGFDPTTRSWYTTAAASKGKAVFTDPVVSADEKHQVTVMTAKTTDDGSGVVGGSISFTKLATSVANIKVGDKGYVFILDKNKKYLVHPTKPAGELNSDSYIQEMFSKDSGSVDYVFNGVPKRAVFTTNKETGWKVVGTIEMTEITNATNKILYTTLIVVAISLIFGAILAFWIISSINNPLKQLIGATGRIANGDLTEEIPIKSKDEIAELSKSVNNMVHKLRNLIGGVISSSQNVAAASEEISATTEEIASGSTTQAEAAQSMSELFNELSSAINSVAISAEEAAELAAHTTTIAQEGGNIVRKSVDSMNQVNTQISLLQEDSNKIGEIIEVIGDIADQTNLLALNAAIEAARAGDQGRGFAVVADEVRKLAERSGEATKQITAIIKGMQENTRRSVSAVTVGVEQSVETGTAFDKIVEMINKTELKVSEIAAASEEQAAQTNEVNHSISNISSASQEAAAASEETAATSQSLAQLAEELNTSVSVFKIK